MHEAELKIYFAGSIRGGREFKDTYFKMIRMLQSLGRVFTEHIGDTGDIIRDDKGLSDREIHDRDMDWLIRSDLLIAEVSVPSLGVGYEIGRAIHLAKPNAGIQACSSSYRLIFILIISSAPLYISWINSSWKL